MDVEEGDERARLLTATFPDASQGFTEEATQLLAKQRLATNRQLEKVEQQFTVAQKVAKAKQSETAAQRQKENVDKMAVKLAAAAAASSGSGEAAAEVTPRR